MIRELSFRLCLGIGAAALWCANAHAQDAGTAADPAPEPLPSLDDLLGLESEERPDDVNDDLPHQSALERALSDEQVADAFRQAVVEMRDVADLLDAGHAGARAQRLQEEILLKLDQLIEQSKQQSQSSSSSSSSSSQSQSSPTSNEQRAQQQQQQASATGSSPGDAPPGSQEGALNELLQNSAAAWGSLPQRVREALMQGSSDRFSTLYESLTESYYRRLAEEAQQ